jgi:four helix bundle suffix protein
MANEDFLRQRGFGCWDKGHPKALEVRALAGAPNRSSRTYATYLAQPDLAANTLICLIHQTNFLLDQQLKALERAFLEDGGFSENLYKKRFEYKLKNGD